MLETKEERKYEQLKELGQELGIPIFQAFLELEVRNKDGELIQEHKQRSHSWVRNAFNVMMSNLGSLNMRDAAPHGGGRLNLRRTDGSIFGGVAQAAFFSNGSTAANFEDAHLGGFRAGVAVATGGIVVGSGTVPESFEDFALQAPIAEGTGAGQLNHIMVEPIAVSYAAVTRVLTSTFTRFFNNNSGGSISVNEVGLIARPWHIGTVLCARDVLPTSVVVPNTGQLRVTYTISLVYPA